MAAYMAVCLFAMLHNHPAAGMAHSAHAAATHSWFYPLKNFKPAGSAASEATSQD